MPTNEDHPDFDAETQLTEQQVEQMFENGEITEKDAEELIGNLKRHERHEHELDEQAKSTEQQIRELVEDEALVAASQDIDVLSEEEAQDAIAEAMQQLHDEGVLPLPAPPMNRAQRRQWERENPGAATPDDLNALLKARTDNLGEQRRIAIASHGAIQIDPFTHLVMKFEFVLAKLFGHLDMEVELEPNTGMPVNYQVERADAKRVEFEQEFEDYLTDLLAEAATSPEASGLVIAQGAPK